MLQSGQYYQHIPKNASLFCLFTLFYMQIQNQIIIFAYDFKSHNWLCNNVIYTADTYIYTHTPVILTVHDFRH